MISLFTHYSGLREYVGTNTDMPPFDVPNGSKFSQMDGKTYWFDSVKFGEETLDCIIVDRKLSVPYVGVGRYEFYF